VLDKKGTENAPYYSILACIYLELDLKFEMPFKFKVTNKLNLLFYMICAYM